MSFASEVKVPADGTREALGSGSRTRMVKTVGITSVLVTLSVLAAAGAYRHWAANRPILPSYVEPEPPFAPAARSLVASAVVGHTRLDELRAALDRLGIECADASVSRFARRLREDRLAALEVSGRDEIDGVTRASLSRPSRHERNPQVRLACDVRIERFDSGRTPGEGRVLAVFDSAETPLRSISLQRRLERDEDARIELSQSLSRLEQIYGAAHQRLGEPEVMGRPFRRFATEGAVWRWGDVEVRVTATRLGASGVSMDETVQVPWPVRPDAPARH